MKAFCWRTGLIEIGAQCPDGAIVIASGTRRELELTMGVLARHGYKAGVLLVPGVPEADDSDAKIEALLRFGRFVRRDLRERRQKREAAKRKANRVA